LHVDSGGRIWISAADRIMRYANDLEGFVQVKVLRRDSTHVLGPVFSEENGHIGLFSAEGLHRLDPAGRSFGYATPLQEDQPLHATDLFGRYGQQIFFRAGSYLYTHNRFTGQVRKLPNKNGFRLFPLSENLALLSTWENDTFLYNFSTGTIHLMQLPLAYQRTSGKTLSIRSAIEEAPGHLLVAAREGFFAFDTARQEFRKLSLYHDGYPELTNDFTQQMYLDGERNVWMLTVEGLARFSLEHPALGLLRIPQPENQPQGSVNNVRQITEDREGNLWIATGNGFVQWQKKDGRWIHYSAESGARDRLSHPSIRGIAVDGQKIILGPTNFGIWIYDPLKDRYQRPAYMHDSVKRRSERDFFDDITPLRNGNFLLLGRDALYLMQGGNYRLSIVDVPASRSNTNRAFERPDGMIWVGTSKGLHLLDASLKHVERTSPEGDETSIWTGFLRRDGSLLFPASNGLYVAQWNGEQIGLRKIADLFDGSFLNCVSEDGKGIVWASSEKGIYRFNPTSGELHLLDYTDNIQGYGFNGNGPFRNRNGIEFWGGQHGINYLNPETFTPPTSKLRVYIQNVRRGLQDSTLVALTGEEELPYQNRSLEIELLAPYFNNPDKVKYRYRIVGIDEDWKFLGNNNRVRLTSLPTGRYNLQVQATLDNVNWTDAEQSFAFRVTEPFWLQTWFLSVCAALMVAGLLGFMDFRNRKRVRQQETERMVMETKQKITDAEMQALRAQMNPHFIFNSLNSINRYIVKSDQATASLYLTRFARLIRLILDNSNSHLVSLSRELEALRLYIEMESIRFDKQFSWEVSVDESVQPDAIQVPPLVIQPYVENAIWHGLLNKETAGHLRAHVGCRNDQVLEVIIEDNGIGREAARNRKGKTTSGNKSLGMTLTEERLRLMNRKLSLNATVVVEDLHTPEGAASGTRVNLNIPIDRD
jgi:Histidine kinase/Y_Y_Y domain/Two component regulator propeller